VTSNIARLNDFGQAPWYDNITRAMVREGGLEALVRDDGIRGVTSNPTIFEKAIAGGEGYDEAIAAAKQAGDSIEDTFWDLAIDDIGRGAEILRPVHDSLGGNDGFISIEVSPKLAHETDATIQQAKELFGRLGRPNVMIKIPATPEGLPAITAVIGAGINVNVTLIFALARYGEVIDAYMSGLETLDAAGGDLSKVHSVASFFVSRVDTETDRRLPEGSPLRGKAAVANAKIAYEQFRASLATERWQRLAAKGATVQRPLWASTSTKNDDYSPTLYVDTLIGPDTVNTLAPKSIDALHEPGVELRADTVTERLEDAHQVLADLEGAGQARRRVDLTLGGRGSPLRSFLAAGSGSFVRSRGSVVGVGEVAHLRKVRGQRVARRVCVRAARVRHHVAGRATEACGLLALRRVGVDGAAVAGETREADDRRRQPLDDDAQARRALGVLVPGERVRARRGPLHQVGEPDVGLHEGAPRIAVGGNEPGVERRAPEAVRCADERDTALGCGHAGVQAHDEHAQHRGDEVGEGHLPAQSPLRQPEALGGAQDRGARARGHQVERHRAEPPTVHVELGARFVVAVPLRERSGCRFRGQAGKVELLHLRSIARWSRCGTGWTTSPRRLRRCWRNGGRPRSHCRVVTPPATATRPRPAAPPTGPRPSSGSVTSGVSP
jgi:transaldolase